MKEMDRRRVVQILCALGVGALAAPDAYAQSHAATLVADIDANAIRELAEAWRQAAPHDGSTAPVRSLLQDEHLSYKEAVSRLRRMMSEDFESGRVVTVAGWMLSATEGRLLKVASELLTA
jgi:hypothetical protein